MAGASAEKLFTEGKLIIYTDGGSRGNPGPAAIGAVIGNKKYGEPIGTATNNVAEYKAVVFALKKAKFLLGKKVSKQTDLEVKIDSELIYKQMHCYYKILEKDLQSFEDICHNLIYIQLCSNCFRDFKRCF